MPESIDEVMQAVWQELGRAAGNPQHNWRLPVLATVDGHGLPQARTVVLRGSDRLARQLVIFSDRRSPKIAQINQCRNVVLVFWSRALGWQLRVSGMATVDSHSNEAARIWERLRDSSAAGDYLRADAPGTTIVTSPAGSHLAADPTTCPEADRSGRNEAEGRANGFFCRLMIQVDQMDWLDLRTEGHRRLRWSETQAQWLVP